MTSYCGVLFLACFLPVVMLGYQLLPQRHRWKWMLLASYFFFWSISGKLLVFLLLSIGSMYLMGKKLEELNQKKKAELKLIPKEEKKAWKAEYQKKMFRLVGIFVVFHLGILLVLKYAGFFLENVNGLLTPFHLPWELPVPRFALPIGISFYTMQAVSYLIDVYRGTIHAETHLGKLALYMSFFPSLMEGPICRYSDTGEQLWKCEPIRYENLTFGLQRVCYGLVKKIVIADRLNPLVKEVYLHWTDYDGGMMAAAMVCYTCQLYMEFSGTMDVVIGVAEIFGVKLPENFKRPFFSHSISEFWTRWHITLGTWFKDYIFYTLSLSAPLKKLTSNGRKRFGNHYGPMLASSIALFCVWLANGLWHGDAWNYIGFGMWHFLLILMANLAEPVLQERCAAWNLNRKHPVWRAWMLVRTVFLVCIGELIFRAHGMQAALGMLYKMFTSFTLASFRDGTILDVGLDWQDFAITAVTLLFVWSIDLLKERGVEVRKTVAANPISVRWMCYLALVLFVLIFGAYGIHYTPVDPIYAGF